MKIPLRAYWNLLVSYLKPQWPMAMLLALLLFGNIGLQLVNPQIMRRFIDVARSGGAEQTLFRVALLFIGVALVQQVASVLATYIGENVGWTATNALRNDVADHCLGLDMSFHNAHTPGEMIERIDGDINALSTFFSQFVIQVFGNALLLVGVLILLFREDWRVGAAFSAFVLAALFSTWRLRDIAVPHWEAERQASADQFGFLEERLAGTEDIRACGAKAYVMRRFYELMRDLMNKSLRAGLMVNVMVNTSMILFAIGNAAAFALGAYLYLSGSISIGTAFIIGWYSNMLLWPIQRITWQMQELQRAGAGITRIRALLSTESRIREKAGRPDLGQVGSGQPVAAQTLPTPALATGPLALEFRAVSFGYGDAQAAVEPDVGCWHERGSPEGAGQGAAEVERAADSSANGPVDEAAKEMVLHDLSFRLSPGTVLGLLGRTGSGKTTLTRLIFRLYDPDSGAVCLGNGSSAADSAGAPSPSLGSLVDIRDLPLATLRQRVGMVTQSIQLFHATVRDNLTFFNREVADERILDVFRDLGMWEWYQSLPSGLDTDLESGGGGLSAGEAQLLAFARIFLQNPGLVILDEASSRLDPATEHLIERAVDRLLYQPRRTAIVIAHRLGTVQRADQIMILEGGRICEYGSRAALAHDPASHLYRLLQTGMEEMLA